MSESLTLLEGVRLSELEAVIERGVRTFIEVGEALAEIRDSGLYRDSHATFEDYCLERWQLKRAHAYRQIEAAQVAAALSPMGDIPANERQARELAPLLRDEGERAVVEVWRGLREEHGDAVTAEHVARAVRNEIRWRTKREAARSLAPVELPPPRGEYPVLLADPPWRYEGAMTPDRAVENHYPTMTLEELRALPIPAAPDAVLFMWATTPKLAEAIDLMGAWGFTYRTGAVWVKDKIGLGNYFRQRHELLLLGKRGTPAAPEPADRPDSVITAPRGRHSAKPDEVYGLIERMYPGRAKIELFARGERDGWAAWGNEVEAREAA